MFSQMCQCVRLFKDEEEARHCAEMLSCVILSTPHRKTGQVKIGKSTELGRGAQRLRGTTLQGLPPGADRLPQGAGSPWIFRGKASLSLFNTPRTAVWASPSGQERGQEHLGLVSAPLLSSRGAEGALMCPIPGSDGLWGRGYLPTLPQPTSIPEQMQQSADFGQGGGCPRESHLLPQL